MKTVKDINDMGKSLTADGVTTLWKRIKAAFVGVADVSVEATADSVVKRTGDGDIKTRTIVSSESDTYYALPDCSDELREDADGVLASEEYALEQAKAQAEQARLGARSWLETMHNVYTNVVHCPLVWNTKTVINGAVTAGFVVDDFFGKGYEPSLYRNSFDWKCSLLFYKPAGSGTGVLTVGNLNGHQLWWEDSGTAPPVLEPGYIYRVTFRKYEAISTDGSTLITPYIWGKVEKCKITT